MAEIQSIKRALDILDLLTTCSLSSRGVSLQEIADHLGVNAPTAHNIIKTMSNCGYLARDKTQGYVLGPKWSDTVRGAEFTEKAIFDMTVAMNKLAQITGESLILATLARGKRYPLIRIEGYEVIRVNPSFDDGNHIFNVVTGRVLAAFATQVELDAIIKVNGLPEESWNGIDIQDKLAASLENVRSDGYAQDCLDAPGIVAMAVPVLNSKGKLISALGTYLPKTRANSERLIEIRKHMQDTAAHIGKI